MRRPAMRKALVLLAGIAILVAVNWSIHAREQLLADGRVVLLELAPVDPRSLMQGDYMALRFKVANDAFGRAPAKDVTDGRIVLAVDERSVGTFARLDDGTRLADGEARIRYRIRNHQA